MLIQVTKNALILIITTFQRPTTTLKSLTQVLLMTVTKLKYTHTMLTTRTPLLKLNHTLLITKTITHTLIRIQQTISLITLTDTLIHIHDMDIQAKKQKLPFKLTK